MSELLDSIHGPNDIKKIQESDYRILAKEIRNFLLRSISKTGGHLASNLGIVELTMALHLSLNLPTDKIIWDVGHQAYVHKLLTGRKDKFDNLRQYGGMSGFPKTCESECDSFNTGHSSTSISAALGFVKARDLLRRDETIVAVIGDGALSGGMAYEALNNAGRLKSNMIIILNDNNMSIAENVGGMSNYLGHIRTAVRYNEFKDDVVSYLERFPSVGQQMIGKLKRSKDSIKRLMIQGMLFEDMGITYIGPIDGHNIREMQRAIESAKKAKKAVLIHVVTQKGKGYRHAEDAPSKFHGVEPFLIKTGKSIKEKQDPTYTDIFSDKMIQLGKENPAIVGITAAMPQGTGLAKFQELYEDRFVDVGIAEEHAVTFAAGMASNGFRPVVAIYSSFLQRAYDQILHDVCINKLPVTFALDRAGLVGADGETHQGIYDLSFLPTIPNLVVMAPKNGDELSHMLQFATSYDGPVAIRYPRGTACKSMTEYASPIEIGKAEILEEQDGILLFAIGSMVDTAMDVKSRLNDLDIPATVVNARFAKPLDLNIIEKLMKTHDMIVTLEENARFGGFGESVMSHINEMGLEDKKQLIISLPDSFIEHGDVPTLKIKYGLDSESIVKKILMKRIQ